MWHHPCATWCNTLPQCVSQSNVFVSSGIHWIMVFNVRFLMLWGDYVSVGQAGSELVVLRDGEREGVGWYCWAGGLQAPAHFRTVRTPPPQSPAMPIKSRAPLYKDCQLCPTERPFCLSVFSSLLSIPLFSLPLLLFWVKVQRGKADPISSIILSVTGEVVDNTHVDWCTRRERASSEWDYRWL